MEKPVYRVLLQEPAGRLFRISPRKSLLLQAERRSEVRRRLWRARRFNRLDPFSGNIQDALSLHKYLYVHGEPISGVDPSGNMTFLGLTGAAWVRISIGVGVGLWTLSMLGAMVNYAYRIAERDTITGTGGKDITDGLEGVVADVNNWWAGLGPGQRHQVFQQIHWTSGWDLSPLNDDVLGQESAFGTGDDWAPRTVTVKGKVYYAHEVNYFLWGMLYAHANKEGITDASRSAMISWVAHWRAVGQFGYLHRRHDGDTQGRSWWASAGWETVFADDGYLHFPSGSAALPQPTPSTVRHITGFQVQAGSHTFPANY